MSLGKVFYYFSPFIKKYKYSLILTLLTYGVGTILATIVNPLLFKEIIDLVSSGEPNIELRSELLAVFSQIVLTIVVYQILHRVGDYAVVYFEAKAIKDISDDTLDRLTKHSQKFFADNFAGSLVAKAKRYVGAFEKIFDTIIFNFWFTLIQLVSIFVVLFIEVPTVAVLILGWSFVYILITSIFIKLKIKYDLLEAEADSRVTGRLSDVIGNILNVKIFSSDRNELQDFSLITDDQYQKKRSAWNMANLQNIVQGALNAILQIATLYFMINLWLDGELSTGMLVLIQTFLFRVFDQLWGLSKHLVNFSKSVSNAKEMVEIFETEPDIKDPQNPENVRIKSGHISFENVSFAYNTDQELLSDFNLEIKPGEHVGFVGHSGAGKTTITKLLLRFSDVTSGAILIDGQDIRNITQNDLRNHISYVPQDPILFHRTIKENIAYGKKGATEEEIIEATKKAHAHEFVEALPLGYDTKVGERGIKLSGGERQRVAISRAMLEGAPIIVLDEATSALDSMNEYYIQKAFANLMEGKTSIVIAHRLSTVQKMDRIIVLDQGKIIEQGSHDELLEKNGVYKSLWDRQTGGFIE